jgi:hypothetical protein
MKAMRKTPSILVVLVLTATVLAAQNASAAPAASPGPSDIENLKAAVEKAPRGQQGKLYAELAERLVNVANQQFTDGKSTEAQATVQEVLQCSIKAHDLALSTRKNRKEIEISLRQTQRHLEDMKHSLAAEDRPPVDAVEKKLGDLRQELLDALFGPNPKKESK